MPRTPTRLALAALLLAALAAAAPGPARLPARTDALPPLMLWAWEWPQDLRGLDSTRVGVAYLAGTVTLARDSAWVRARRQPLRVSPGTALVAVARVQVASGARPALSARQARIVAREVAWLARRRPVRGVQLDFDSRASQRAFHRELLAAVRSALPDTLGLTMTALASWGFGDDWLAGLPVDAAVPMLFRMGAEGPRVRASLARGEDFAPALCRANIGVAMDEPLPVLARGRRTWVFRTGPWTRAAITRVEERFSP